MAILIRSAVLAAMSLLVATPAMALDTSNAISATVTIVAGNSQGSGFFLAADELMTAAHVVQGHNQVTVTLSDGEREFIGDVAAIDTRCDVASITLRGSVEKFFAVAPKQPLDGDKVFAVGSPIGRPVLSEGKVLGVSSFAISTTTPVDHGSSGGPLLDSQGEVLGIIIQKSDRGNAIAVPIAHAQNCLGTGTSKAYTAQYETPPQTLAIAALAVGVFAAVLSITALTVARRRNRPIVITLPPEEK